VQTDTVMKGLLDSVAAAAAAAHDDGRAIKTIIICAGWLALPSIWNVLNAALRAWGAIFVGK
jgi:hypothetical protein